MSSPDFSNWRPRDWITYGPRENCTLALCPIQASVFEYQPSLPANATFIALFGVNLFIHVIQGLRWRTWAFMTAMFLGSLCEIIGYAGRLIMWQNPFSFPGFITQIVCIAIGPAFYSAAIYVTLSQIVTYLGTQYSRLSPAAYYYIFITCDVISLTLQGTGGGLSSTTSGQSKIGVDIAIAGLSFQVFTLTVFICLATDYAIRYARARNEMETKTNIPTSFKAFAGTLSFAILCILVRCVYRIDELSDGYSGPLIHSEGLFIGLEGVMVVVAAFALNVAHPGPIFFGKSKLAPPTGVADPEVEDVNAVQERK